MMLKEIQLVLLFCFGITIANADSTQKVISVHVGFGHTCAHFENQTIKCWGLNQSGQLGLGDKINRGGLPNQMGANLPTVDLGKGIKVIDLAAGYWHTCALLSDQTVKCWGGNGYGQLGLGDTVSRGETPDQIGDALPTVDLGTNKKAIAISANGDHSCAILNDHSIKCWGSNASGQLGLGDDLYRGSDPGEMGDNLPSVNLGKNKKAISLALGVNHTCALLSDQTIKCWGSNLFGQLGTGDQHSRGTSLKEMGDFLLPVDLGDNVKAISVTANFSHTCALLSDQSIKCWGDNRYGQLGLGDTKARGQNSARMGNALPRVDLGNGMKANAISSGYDHTCALLSDQTIKCWGSNSNGQLGLGDSTDRGITPDQMGDFLPKIQVSIGIPIRSISLGVNRTCVVLNVISQVKCWGFNFYGELGLEDQENDRGADPSTVPALLPYIEL